MTSSSSEFTTCMRHQSEWLHVCVCVQQLHPTGTFLAAVTAETRVCGGTFIFFLLSAFQKQIQWELWLDNLGHWIEVWASTRPLHDSHWGSYSGVSSAKLYIRAACHVIKRNLFPSVRNLSGCSSRFSSMLFFSFSFLVVYCCCWYFAVLAEAPFTIPVGIAAGKQLHYFMMMPLSGFILILLFLF